MNLTLKKLVPSTVILCAVLIMGSCSPAPENKVPTQAIRVINIQNIVSKTGVTPYKMYIQLSNGTSSKDSNVAEGSSKVLGDTPPNEITIDLYQPGTPYKQNPTPFNSTDWKNHAIIVSPKTTSGPKDIVILASPGGATDSSTVTVNVDNEIVIKYNSDGTYGMDYFIAKADFDLLYNNLIYQDAENNDPDITHTTP